ncbi:hypothetical protein FN846DRAFT_896394 [Sphaerosporella brunnea]|uniref:Uncharacterized protein n=1 Tax=Sphaerosporella brunnea TaxID=1250544 RepID=A0A5J5EC78_9PEZI|nr:hypothetical protein FN846DRAFT_896394 [Sphaerosporella brunnea]
MSRRSSTPNLKTEPTVTLYRGSDTGRAEKFIAAKNNKDVLKNLTPAGGGDFHQRSATEEGGVFSPASYWTDDPRFAKTWAASKNTDDGGAVIEIQVPISFLYGTDTIEYPEPKHNFITRVRADRMGEILPEPRFSGEQLKSVAIGPTPCIGYKAWKNMRADQATPGNMRLTVGPDGKYIKQYAIKGAALQALRKFSKNIRDP